MSFFLVSLCVIVTFWPGLIKIKRDRECVYMYIYIYIYPDEGRTFACRSPYGEA